MMHKDVASNVIILQQVHMHICDLPSKNWPSSHLVVFQETQQVRPANTEAVI